MPFWNSTRGLRKHIVEPQKRIVLLPKLNDGLRKLNDGSRKLNDVPPKQNDGEQKRNDAPLTTGHRLTATGDRAVTAQVVRDEVAAYQVYAERRPVRRA